MNIQLHNIKDIVRRGRETAARGDLNEKGTHNG